eukprot:scaffold81865_cov18-Tisochrysis_lutea.AAC.1
MADEVDLCGLHVEGGNQSQSKSPLTSLLQLHYPLSSPDNDLLQEYTLPPQVGRGKALESNEIYG